MKAQTNKKWLKVTIAATSLLAVTSSCGSDSRPYSQESTTMGQYAETPCGGLRQECLQLFTTHSSELARVVKARSQQADPSTSDVVASVVFAAAIYEKEEQIRQNCPESFKTYQDERDDLIKLLVAKEVAKELF